MSKLTKAQLLANNEALEKEIEKLKALPEVDSDEPRCIKHGRANCSQEICKGAKQ